MNPTNPNIPHSRSSTENIIRWLLYSKWCIFSKISPPHRLGKPFTFNLVEEENRRCALKWAGEEEDVTS